MSDSIMQIVSDGSLSTVPLTIDFFEQSHITVLVDNVVLPSPSYSYVWSGAATITINPAVAAGLLVRIQRKTPSGGPLHNFQAGAVFSELSVDDNFKQDLFLLQEAREQAIVLGMANDLDMHGYRIKNMADGIQPTDAATLQQLLSVDTTVGALHLRNELASPGGAGLVGGLAKPVTWAGFAGGADPTGVEVSDAAFAAASAYQYPVAIPDGTYRLSSDISGDFLEGSAVSYIGGGRATPKNVGFWPDQHHARLHRIRDRVFIGEGAAHTGRRTAPLGDTWLTKFGANYFEKNAQAIALGIQGRYGAVVGGWSSDGIAPAGGESNKSSIGLAAVGLNKSTSGTARAIYAEGMHFGGGLGTSTGSTAGIEVQLGNYSLTDNTGAGPYTLGPGTYGVTVGVEAGTDYVLGDSNTPLQTPTLPATAAMYIYGGSLGASYQKWRNGIIFLQNSLYRGSDGFSGNASAIKMAQGHQIEWWSGTATKNATIRSDAVAIAGQETSLLFKNNRVELCGSDELPILALTKDTGGTPVSNAYIRNARNNIAVVFGSEGSSRDIPISIRSKGNGVISLHTHDGTSEHLRVDANPGATDFVTVRGGAGNGVANINTGGVSADVHLRLTPKGLGTIQYGKTQTPITDNQLDYGSAPLRGRTAFFGTGTINTSDAREKTAPMLIDDAVLDAWGDVQLITFRWLDAIQQKGEDAARWHFGVIAQQVRDAFATRGLDGTHYGLLCYDEWDDTYTKVQTNEGEIVTKTRPVRKPVMIPGKDGGEPVVKMVMVYLKNEDGSPKLSENGTRLTDFEVVFEDVEEEYLDYADPEYADVLEVAAGNRWGIRPDQCLFLEAAYQRRRCDRIEARLLASGL